MSSDLAILEHLVQMILEKVKEYSNSRQGCTSEIIMIFKLGIILLVNDKTVNWYLEA